MFYRFKYWTRQGERVVMGGDPFWQSPLVYTRESLESTLANLRSAEVNPGMTAEARAAHVTFFEQGLALLPRSATATL